MVDDDALDALDMALAAVEKAIKDARLEIRQRQDVARARQENPRDR